MDKHPIGLRTAAASALLALLVSCGGGDSSISVPDAVGMRVVYVTDSPENPGRMQAYAADTLSMDQRVTKISGDVPNTDFVGRPIVSFGGRFVGAWVSRLSACPSHYALVDTLHRARVNVMGNGGCVDIARFNSTGDVLGIIFSSDDGVTFDFGMMAIADGSQNVVNTFGAPSGAFAFAFSGDGQVAAWVDQGGLHSASAVGGGSGSIASDRSNDRPPELVVTPNGSTAVYSPDGQRFVMTELRPNLAPSQSYLTAPLPVGDQLAPGYGGFALAPDGSALLYLVRHNGADQLWFVPLAAPLTEQRVDAAAPIPADSLQLPVFAFNADGSRFAWKGDVGGGDWRVKSATVAAPTTATTLTASLGAVGSSLAWSGTDVVVYDVTDAPTGRTTLQTTSVNSPLASVTMSRTDLAGYNVFDLTVCGDGTLVYLLGYAIPSTGAVSALYSAQPMVAGSFQQITPEKATVLSLNYEIACEK